MLSKFCLMIVWLLMLTPAHPALACSGNQSGDIRFDPCPDQDDFALPMPGNLKMVFRKVAIPGKEFWGHSQRIIQVGGDATKDVFQGRLKAMIGGGFPDPTLPQWYYYLGKYEVTKAQFAAVMGQGDIRNGIARLIALSGDPDDKKLVDYSGEKLDKELAKPVSWIGWIAVQEFMHAYNRWCYDDTACLNAMPKIKAKDDREEAQGFIRLPTELEWEYAARGGLAALDNIKFADPLPFNSTDWKKYAFVQPEAKTNPKRIGTLNPTDGIFYDLFGNVQEITADLFQADMGLGKAGALTVRGGSYWTHSHEITSAYRLEVPFYEIINNRVIEGRPTTGFRVAIASSVMATQKYITQIKQEYNDYLGNIRNDIIGPATPQIPVEELKKIIATLSGQNEGLKNQLTNIMNNLQRISRDLDFSNQKVCDSYVKQAIIFSNLMVRSYRERHKQTKLVEILSRKQNLSASEQENIAKLKTASEHEQRQIDFYFRKYSDEVNKLYNCGNRLAQGSIDNFRAEINRGNVSSPEQAAFNLFLDHFEKINRGASASFDWRDQIIKYFELNQLLMYL